MRPGLLLVASEVKAVEGLKTLRSPDISMAFSGQVDRIPQNFVRAMLSFAGEAECSYQGCIGAGDEQSPVGSSGNLLPPKAVASLGDNPSKA